MDKKEAIAKALTVVKETDSANEIRAAQSILLSYKHGLSLSDAGEIIGRSKRTVLQLNKDYMKGKKQGDNWGGRRKAYLDYETEKEFLQSFTGKSEQSGIIIVSEIQKAYEKKIGKKVAKSTIYDLLHRHNWRKITPRKSHPKADKKNRKTLKKT
ncbi:MAG: winged helix-turn-helix domain-containing protein [Oligoflexia bacterium]|nr:winged helix-turn-helix domain-containing protein [Oligoflexia bacterium]